MPQSSRKMIFHIPLPLDENAMSASGIRPPKMLKGFEEAGFEVDAVTGNAEERKAKSLEILNKIKNGEKYSFCYSESSTMPTALTEKHHLPLHPFFDFAFFKELKKNGIPIGLFYRDIFWAFDLYKKSVSPLKRFFAYTFYKYDLKMYNKFVDVLFLPSVQMLNYIPFDMKIKNVCGLPSGCEVYELEQQKHDGEGLNILYIGGVTTPLYDITPLVEAVKNNRGLSLTVVCRKNEYDVMKNYYNMESVPNISVIHGRGDIVEDCYKKADVFSIVRSFDEYLTFAMPFKLFEAVSHGVPVVTSPGTSVADFVESNDVGWVVDGNYGDFLQKLAENKKLIEEKRKSVIKAIPENTWKARALFVAKQLSEEI